MPEEKEPSAEFKAVVDELRARLAETEGPGYRTVLEFLPRLNEAAAK